MTGEIEWLLTQLTDAGVRFFRGWEIEPAERLRWLERTMAELRALKGRAGQA